MIYLAGVGLLALVGRFGVVPWLFGFTLVGFLRIRGYGFPDSPRASTLMALSPFLSGNASIVTSGTIAPPWV